jgi:hypothetical protein
MRCSKGQIYFKEVRRMRDVFYGVTAVYETAALREKLGEKFAELEKERGIKVREKETFVPFVPCQEGEEGSMVLPEIVREIRPHHYTTHIQVTKPWIGTIIVLGSGKKLNPSYQDDRKGTMGYFARGGVTVYAVTTRGYVEIEYVSAYPTETGQLRFRRNLLFESADLALQAAAPEELIEGGVAKAIQDVPRAYSGYIMEAFEMAKSRIRAYRQANPRTFPKTQMREKLEEAGLLDQQGRPQLPRQQRSRGEKKEKEKVGSKKAKVSKQKAAESELLKQAQEDVEELGL